MNNLDKVIAYFKELGKELKVDDFEDRLVIQKTVCLLKLLGINLNYNFSMYIRGPYSPDLTKDIYEHREIIEKLQTNYIIREDEKKLLRTIYELSDNLDPTLLEIMSTYEFLIKELHNNEKEAIIILKKLKPFYSDARLAIGISRAKQLFFKHTEKEIEEMKSEFAEWEDASINDQNKE